MIRKRAQIHDLNKIRQQIFHICRYSLLFLACIFINAPFVFILAVFVLAVNFIFSILLFAREKTLMKSIILVNMISTVILCGYLLIDNLNTPRFIEKSHAEWFGVDAVVICRVLFWISFIVSEGVRLFHGASRKQK